MVEDLRLTTCDLGSRLKSLSDKGNLRGLHSLVHEGRFVENEGKRMLNLSGNDYLGLSERVDLRREFLEELLESNLPLGSTSSRLLTGNFPVYEELEELIARSYGREAALLFNSGYHANVGILPAICNKRTLVLADKLVHASLIDGLRLSEGTFQRYRHNDLTHLKGVIDRLEKEFEQIIVVTESIFSMDGDEADIQQLIELKRNNPKVLLYIDEAHAIGVRGENGLGLCEEAGCVAEIDLLVGTFGKALASMGSYVVCSKEMRLFLINTMRPLIFSTALPPATVAWSLFVFERLEGFRAERERLRELSRLFESSLKIEREGCRGSHIIPYIIGENSAAVQKAKELQQEGFFVLPIRPPTVAEGTARLRFSLSAGMKAEELQPLIDLLKCNKE